MKTILLTLYIALSLGCAAAAPSAAVQPDPRDEIEVQVRAYWHNFDPTLEPSAFSYQKIGDVYLVSTAFANPDRVASGKTVAQQFRSSNGTTAWRIEPFNSRWRSLLRIQE